MLLLCMLLRLFFSYFAKLDMLITTIGIITIGTTFGIEIVMIIKKSVFIERTRDNTYINFSFLKVNHAEMKDCKLAFIFSCIHYNSCCNQ